MARPVDRLCGDADLGGDRPMPASSSSHVRVRSSSRSAARSSALLREFEAAGSGGLWELDRDLMRHQHLDANLPSAIGQRRPQSHRHALPASCWIPTGEVPNCRRGMRPLFDHFDRGERVPRHRDPGDRRPAAGGRCRASRWVDATGEIARLARGRVGHHRRCACRGDDAVARGAARSADRSRQSPAGSRIARRGAADADWRERAGARCCWSTSTASSWSTTRSAMRSATSCWSRSARRLETAVGDGGGVGRLGGDEFAVIWRGAGRPRSARRSCRADHRRPQPQPSRSARPTSTSARPSASRAGPLDGKREETVDAQRRPRALSAPRKQGAAAMPFSSRRCSTQAEDHRLLENDVRDALRGDGLQARLSADRRRRSGAVVGREALLRWRHPTRGDIPPDLFIPIIEDAGLIHQIGDWVIREACAEAASWPDELRSRSTCRRRSCRAGARQDGARRAGRHRPRSRAGSSWR